MSPNKHSFLDFGWSDNFCLLSRPIMEGGDMLQLTKELFEAPFAIVCSDIFVVEEPTFLYANKVQQPSIAQALQACREVAHMHAWMHPEVCLQVSRAKESLSVEAASILFYAACCYWITVNAP